MDQESIDTCFELMQCNYRAVQWFMEHEAGIWRSGLNGIESLDYGQVRSAMRLEGIKEKQCQKLFRQLLHIERGFIVALNQEKKKE